MRVATIIIHNTWNEYRFSTMNAHSPEIRSTSILLEHKKRRCKSESAHDYAPCIVITSALHLLTFANCT